MGAAKVPVIVGPTAVGKTAVALALAAHWPLEVVSADSRQVYRRLDIGTAKPTRRERARLPHHGLDMVEPTFQSLVVSTKKDSTVIPLRLNPMLFAPQHRLSFRFLQQ